VAQLGTHLGIMGGETGAFERGNRARLEEHRQRAAMLIHAQTAAAGTFQMSSSETREYFVGHGFGLEPKKEKPKTALDILREEINDWCGDALN